MDFASDRIGRDLAAVDWAGTPLGPPETWPTSLRAIARTMLASRFSMWMAWGPELTFFCNEAYRRDTLASKYPWALGRPAREVWAEIWLEICPRIDRVLAGGEATWDEGLLLYLHRSGYPEETYHTFSYSPLVDDLGAVAGMLCVVSEDTGRVVSTRRMATLRDLGGGTAGVLTPAGVLAQAAAVLGRNRRDFPFALFYRTDPDPAKDTRGTAGLAHAIGLAAGHPAAPSVVEVGPAGAIWPLTDGDARVVDLAGRFPDLPTGDQPGPPTRAMVVPLTSQSAETPAGWLIVGLNRYRPLNEAHRGFLELVGRQISAAVAAAAAYEDERRRAEQLAELDRAKTAFFTNVSHELRTPLTLMLGPTADALADDDPPLPEPHRRRVEVAHRNAERLLGLVNTLLDFSGLEDGREVPCPVNTDLAQYTAELVAVFDAAIAEAGLTVTVSTPALRAPVAIDREMWAKVVLNLISNALKFTFTGGIAVELRAVELRAVDDAESAVELIVRDTGIGIEPADQPRLFERFSRVVGARSRTHEGSGIGLALVAELTALLGGTVTVESAPGVGSAFTVRIPMRTGIPGLPELDPALAEHGHQLLAEVARWRVTDDVGAPAGGPPPGAPRVLVVDDNADMRAYLAALLAGEYQVQVAADGRDALSKARAAVPDLVLTDVMMPHLDGLGLLQALREDPATAGVPVVIVSARAGEDGVAEGLEAGADDYLVKPFAARELRARVRANLELDRSRRMRTELERKERLLDQAQRLARVGSWEVDLATGRISASPQFARMVDLTQDEVQALDLEAALSTLLHPQDRQRVADALAAGVEGAPIFYEAVFRTGIGTDILMEIVGEMERDPAGNPRTLRGSIQDIAARRRAELESSAAAAAREVAAREHQIAEELQASLLPALDFDPDHLSVATYYRAGVEGTQVGGDWYDVIELGAGRTALVIGDVMGRGVRAAAVMGQLRSAIRAYARLDLPPAQVLELCDGAVRELGADQIVTCVYAVYDPVESSLSYANAGHLPPLLADPGRPGRRLPGHGPPLGTGPRTFATSTVAMAPGMTLALYTDGLVERRDRDIDAGLALLECQVGAAGLAPAELVARMLPHGPDDDVAVLLARVRLGGDRMGD